MPQTPTLNDVVDDAMDTRLENFWTSVPATVLSFDSNKHRAKIKVLLANAVEDGAGNKHWYHPTVYNVPVVFPWGTGSNRTGYGITFPFGVGDTGLYVVSSLPTHGWQSNGVNAGKLDEDRSSRNNIAHGFLIPGIHANSQVPVPVEQDALVLHGLKVKIGGPTATEPTLMGDTFMTDFAQFLVKLLAVTTPLGALPGMSATVTPFATQVTAMLAAMGIVPLTNVNNYLTARTEVK